MERFMALYQEVYQDLYRLAYYYLGNPEDAEDAVQDAVLAAFEGFGRLRKEEAFRPWIFRILVNRCRKMWRRRRPEEPAKLPEVSYEPSLTTQAELMELLHRLSDEERLIVCLSVFGGYKGEEIARILNKSHSTIRSKYRRALKKLELEIGKESMQG